MIQLLFMFKKENKIAIINTIELLNCNTCRITINQNCKNKNFFFFSCSLRLYITLHVCASIFLSYLSGVAGDGLTRVFPGAKKDGGGSSCTEYFLFVFLNLLNFISNVNYNFLTA